MARGDPLASTPTTGPGSLTPRQQARPPDCPRPTSAAAPHATGNGASLPASGAAVKSRDSLQQGRVATAPPPGHAGTPVGSVCSQGSGRTQNHLPRPTPTWALTPPLSSGGTKTLPQGRRQREGFLLQRCLGCLLCLLSPVTPGCGLCLARPPHKQCQTFRTSAGPAREHALSPPMAKAASAQPPGLTPNVSRLQRSQQVNRGRLLVGGGTLLRHEGQEAGERGCVPP